MEWKGWLFYNGQSWFRSTATSTAHGIQCNDSILISFWAPLIRICICLVEYKFSSMSPLFFLQTKPGHSGPFFDINVVTFHWEFNATPVFANLLARIPKWAFPVASTASLQSHTF